MFSFLSSGGNSSFSTGRSFAGFLRLGLPFLPLQRVWGTFHLGRLSPSFCLLFLLWGEEATSCHKCFSGCYSGGGGDFQGVFYSDFLGERDGVRLGGGTTFLPFIALVFSLGMVIHWCCRNGAARGLRLWWRLVRAEIGEDDEKGKIVF